MWLLFHLFKVRRFCPLLFNIFFWYPKIMSGEWGRKKYGLAAERRISHYTGLFNRFALLLCRLTLFWQLDGCSAKDTSFTSKDRVPIRQIFCGGPTTLARDSKWRSQYSITRWQCYLNFWITQLILETKQSSEFPQKCYPSPSLNNEVNEKLQISTKLKMGRNWNKGTLQ